MSRTALCLLFVLCFIVGSFHTATAQDPTLINYGDVARGNLSRTHTDESWIFSGHLGDRIIVAMLADEPDDLDTYLTLVDADNHTLTTDDDSGPSLNALIGPFELPADGEYTVIASRYSGGGNYSLRVLNVATLPRLSEGKPLVGVVDQSHPSDYFVLDTAENSLLRVEAADNERYSDPNLSLFNQTGYVLGTDRQESAVIDPVAAQSDDLYVVEVSWNRDGVGGSYELSLLPSSVMMLDSDIPLDGTIDDEDEVKSYYFSGLADETITVTVVGITPLIPGITITTIDTSQTLFSNIGTAAIHVSATVVLPASSVYRIEVNSLNAASGSFQLLLERP
jgi:hypothetical protein